MTNQELIHGQLFAGCKIDKKIGQGGMGSVYKARHITLDKDVCVKILSKNLSGDQRNVEFFLREARSAAKLEHPNIVQVFNFGEENGTHFIIMSFIDGKPLDEIIKEKGPLKLEEASDIIIAVLKGLQHAHSKTIIHRDIKPSNILMDKNNTPKIVDFGLAKSINEEKQLTMAGEMIGTAYFMSPEQGLAAKADHRADLYSVGATFFYLLTGKYPYEGETSIEVIHKHISDPLPNIFRMLPEAPIWVPKVLQKLMAKKPEDRYQSAKEIIEELKKYKDPENVKSLYSTETSINMPEVTTRVADETPACAPIEPTIYRPDSVYDKTLETAEKEKPVPDKYAVKKTPKKRKSLQLLFLPKAIKTLIHFSITALLTAFFVMAGSLPPAKGIPESIKAPIISNPGKAWLLIIMGVLLSAWAVYLKPKKLTLSHAASLLIIMASAYTAGCMALVPRNFDMIAKTVLILKSAFANLFAPNNLMPYSLFLFLLGAKFSLKENFIVKLFAVSAATVSVFLTYKYFQAGMSPDRDYLMLALIGLCVAAGILISFAKKDFNIALNPGNAFLLANILIFAALAGPQIKKITDNKYEQDRIQVAKMKKAAQKKERLIMDARMPEFDLNGVPIPQKPLNLAAQINPTPLPILKREATKDYYGRLLSAFKEMALKTGGFLIISFLFLLLANLFFIDEIFSFKREDTIS